MKKLHVVVYTDGSCRKNPGHGGWGACLRIPELNLRKDICGGVENTTNNRMEMQACIEALRFLLKRNRNIAVSIYTDSQYVQKGMTIWIHGWKKKKWLSSDGSFVKNADLWRELDILAQQIPVSWHWVRGHSGNKYNEIADRLANQGAVNANLYE